MSGDVTRFRDEAKEAVRREPGYAWTRVMLANALLRADGDFDGADAAVRTALTFAPDAPYMQQVLALIHDSRGDPDAAVLALRRIIENNRLDESGWQQLANQLLKKRLFAKARDGYREYVSLLKAQPAPNPATVASAEQALRRFERVAALAAEYAAMRRGEYDSGDAEDLALAGNMLAAAGEPVRAVGCFERAFAKDAALAASQGNYYRERAVEAAVAAAADAAGLDAAGRAAMRRKAYDWIRAELASAETIVTAAADRDAGRREALRTGMPPAASWTAIGGVVWPSRLATLPPDEAARWRDLWRRQGILRVTLQPTDL
jgi:tetratricopeptide (TPR) repeat protein